MVFPTAEPPFGAFPDFGERGVQEQVQRFAQRYRGQVAQLSPLELAVALQELARLTQAIHPAKMKTPEAKAEATASWRELEQAIFLQNQLLFFPLELQALPADSLDRLVDAPVEPQLQPFRLFLCRLRHQQAHRQPESLERLLHQQHLSGRLAWRQLWLVTLGLPEKSLPAGERPALSLGRLHQLQTHASAEVRWDAYQQLCQHLETHADLGGFILGTLVRDHLWEAQWRGYDSAAELYLARHSLTQAFLENLMEGIRDRLDLFQRYYRLKSRNMGRSIRICDLYAPWADPVPSLTSAEATSLVWAAVQDFCPEWAAQSEPWFLEIDSAIDENRTNPWPGEPGFAGGAALKKALVAISRRLRPADPLVWLDLEELQGAAQPSWGEQVQTAFLQQVLLDYLLAPSARGPLGSPPLGGTALQNLEGGPQLAQALLIDHLEGQLQAVFYQGLVGRLELLLYRSGSSQLDPLWVSEEWLKLCQELCGDAVELFPEHQFHWVGLPELFLRPFSAYQSSLASLVALACYRCYHTSPRHFLTHYLNWLASPPGSLTLKESTRLLQVDLRDPNEVLQGLETLEHWIDTLEELLEEDLA